MSPEELRRVVDALDRVHRFISVITDADALLERVMAESKEVAEAEACSLILYDADRDDLYFHVALGESGDQQVLKSSVRLQVGQGIAGAAAQERRSLNVEDARSDPRFYASADELTRFHTRAVLATPMVDRDKLVGVLEVLNKRGGGAFTEADLRVMEIFSSLAATVITNARLIEQNLRAERLAAIGVAVAGLSHYAKNLITGINGSIELLDAAIAGDDRETVVRCWPMLRRSAARLSSFVEDMLAFSKPREPVRETVDVAEALEEAASAYRDVLARRSVQLEIDCSRAPASFPLDARGMYRCLLNLITNAADAAPREGGAIWLTAWETQDGRLAIEAADNGPGIPEEVRERVCDPFFSTKGSRGTGLGLAVTSKIVAEHGGVLHIGERAGGGACITLVVPPGNSAEES